MKRKWIIRTLVAIAILGGLLVFVVRNPLWVVIALVWPELIMSMIYEALARFF